MPRALTVLILLVACGDLEPESRPGHDGPSQATAHPQDNRASPRPDLIWTPAPPAADIAAPLRLTASDGTGLLLRSMQVQSVIQDPVAFTELHLTFENPEPRTLEGRFEITLPPGAAIGRFAMRIDDRWQEGEVVETQAARRAYEDFLHRRQDPALMEKDAGNQFRARVFPIPANGVKDIIVSYSHELGSEQPFEVMLRGLPKLDRFDARVLVDDFDGEPQELVVSERDFVPDRDLRVAVNPLSDEVQHVGLRSGELTVVRLQPELDVVDDPIAALTVLVDTSASRALGFETAMTKLQHTLTALAADQGALDLDVRAFDQEVATLYRGPASGFSARQLIDRGALGASDLQHALQQLAKSEPHERVLLVTDGVATAGEVQPVTLRGEVAALESAGVQRLDVLVDGGIRDAAMLGELVTAGLPDDGVVFDDHDQAVGRLTAATRSGIEVTVPGAEWVWPDTLNGLQSGDDVWVYAEVAGDQPLSIELHGAQLSGSLQVASTSRPLVERAATQARIARLEHLRARTEDSDDSEALRQEIIELSVEQRVLSDHTSLLVLETEQDYATYGIARRGLADILTVGERGLEVRERGEEAVPLPVTETSSAREKGKRDKREDARNDSFGMRDDDDWDEDVPLDPADLEMLGYIDLEVVDAPPPPPPDARPPAAEPERPSPAPSAAPRPRPARRVAEEGRLQTPGHPDDTNNRRPATADPWTGRFAEVMALLAEDRAGAALEKALTWRAQDPGDVLALVALGEVYSALGELESAARAYGSIIDLFPSRADLRRMAGERLEALEGAGMALAVDSFGKALEQRPDHPSSHRLYAYGLVQLERYDEAFEVILDGHQREWTSGRFRGAERILAEDVGLIAAALKQAEPGRADEIDATVAEVGGVVPSGRSLRFVLYWETDANDVDFHIYDGRNGHAYYGTPKLPSGGELYADVTTGYGPECFTIQGAKAFPYTLQAHYYSRGPMGYGMGTLHTMRHDGKGGIEIEARPYVIMKDGATVGLGHIKR